jgi:predicted site-specific integrase-resolvase
MMQRPKVVLDGKYTLTEAAALLGKDRRTLYNWRKLGYLKTKQHRYTKRPFVLGREILRLYDCI